MTIEPIPIHSNYDWKKLQLIDIKESNEKLVQIPDSRYLRQFPVYYDLEIPHAVNTCVARETVVKMLEKAASILPENLGIVVLDGWRPKEVQVELQNQIREVIKNKYPEMSSDERDAYLLEFVAPADSDFVSPHSTGGSVDVTLYECETGKLLNMGSEFDEPTNRSYTRYYEYNYDDIDACYNRRLLYYVMTKVGFTNLPTEWWHYDYGNQLWAFYSNKEYAIFGSTKWLTK